MRPLDEQMVFPTVMLTGWILVPVLMTVCWWLFRKRLGRPTYPAEGELLMRYGVPVRLLGVFVGVVLPVMFGVGGLLAPPRTDQDMRGIVSAFCFYLVLGVPLLIETHYKWLLVSAEGLTLHSPWRRDRFHRWAEVVRVSIGKGNLLFTFHMRDGGTFMLITSGASGRAFIPYMLRYLDPRIVNQLPRAMRAEEWERRTAPSTSVTLPDESVRPEPAQAGPATGSVAPQQSIPVRVPFLKLLFGRLFFVTAAIFCVSNLVIALTAPQLRAEVLSSSPFFSCWMFVGWPLLIGLFVSGFFHSLEYIRYSLDLRFARRHRPLNEGQKKASVASQTLDYDILTQINLPNPSVEPPNDNNH
jgi:hypothetical protein